MDVQPAARYRFHPRQREEMMKRSRAVLFGVLVLFIFTVVVFQRMHSRDGQEVSHAPEGVTPLTRPH